MAKQTIVQTGAFTADSKGKINDNFTELYAGTSGQTLASPTITGTVAGGATYTAPVLTTPTIGVATATSVNKVAITAPATSATITMTDGKTLAVTNTLTLSGTDSTTMTFPSTTGTVATIAGTQTLTNKTITGAINSDFAVLAGNATYTSTVTPATLTGFAWTVVPGTYVFRVNLPTTMTTVGGMTINFLLTTAVLTSIQYQSYAATAADATTAVSTQGTTAASGTKVFDSKTAAYTLVRIEGSMVVGTGGTFTWQGCQNTSAGAGDVSIVLLGAFAQLTRVA
jgi:hypothetical protein